MNKSMYSGSDMLWTKSTSVPDVCPCLSCDRVTYIYCTQHEPSQQQQQQQRAVSPSCGQCLIGQLPHGPNKASIIIKHYLQQRMKMTVQSLFNRVHKSMRD